MSKRCLAMGKILLLGTFFLLIIPVTSFAQSSVIPHQLEPGDIISADIINEIFTTISDITEGFSSPAELVGTWSWTVYSTSPLSQYLSYYTLDSSGLFYTLSSTITFKDDGDGTYSYEPGTYDIFGFPTTASVSGEYTVIPDLSKIVIKRVNDDGVNPTWVSTNAYFIQKRSPDKFILSPDSLAAVFERFNTTPVIPTDLSATASGLSVVLTWTDNSSDETGFKVSRKDTLEGEFAEIGTTTADIATYTDTLTQSGTYWYRVMATNANGDSLGSNEAMVTVSE